MSSSPLLVLWITLWYSLRSSAEKIPEKINLPDHKYPALVLKIPSKYIPFPRRWTRDHSIMVCPASSEREKRFNDEVSITGNSVFLRNNFSENEIPYPEINICDKLVEPVTLYNTKNRKYEIGYEVYYEESKIQTQYYGSNYNHYKPVNINNEVINSSKNPSQYVVQSQDGEETKFSFANESETLVFRWEPMLSFACSGPRKQLFRDFDCIRDRYFEYIPSKCESYKLDDRDIMNVYLVSDENRFELWKDQHSYGDIEMSQIIPAWYFHTSAKKRASYAPMNMVPIWKSIADGQLKKVDIYLQAVEKYMETMDHWRMDVTFGISGVLEEAFNKQKMYFSDTEHHRRIPIPKIIYRLIEGGQNAEHGGVFNAIIVIHNDPIHVSDSDRICTKEDEVSGWEEIKNNDRRTGLTYVCHYRCKKVFPLRESVLCTNDEFSRPFRLDEISLLAPWSVGEFTENRDGRDEIDKQFREILNKTSDTEFIENVITKYTSIGPILRKIWNCTCK